MSAHLHSPRSTARHLITVRDTEKLPVIDFLSRELKNPMKQPENVRLASMFLRHRPPRHIQPPSEVDFPSSHAAPARVHAIERRKEHEQRPRDPVRFGEREVVAVNLVRKDEAPQVRLPRAVVRLCGGGVRLECNELLFGHARGGDIAVVEPEGEAALGEVDERGHGGARDLWAVRVPDWELGGLEGDEGVCDGDTLEVWPRARHPGDVGVRDRQHPAPAGDLQILQGVQVDQWREDVEERGIEGVAVQSNGDPVQGVSEGEPA